MKRLAAFLFFLTIGACLFYWALKNAGLAGIAAILSRFSFSQGLAIFGLTLLAFGIENWKWQLILKSQGVGLSFFKLVPIHCASFGVNYLAPMLLAGGEISRGYFLNSKYGVSWPKGVSSVIISRVLSWTVNLIAIFLGLYLFFSRFGFFSKNIMLSLAAPLAIFTAAVIFFHFHSFRNSKNEKSFLRFFRLARLGRVFSRRYKQGSGSLEKVRETEKEVFAFFRVSNPFFWQAAIISLAKTAVIILRAWVLIGFLGQWLGPLTVVSLVGFSLLTALIPIPANLGSQEAVQTVVFNVLGLGAGAGAVFAIIIRAAELALAFLGVLFVLKLGVELFRIKLLKKAANLASPAPADEARPSRR